MRIRLAYDRRLTIKENMSITRRTLAGAAGLALLTPAATATAVLILTPRQTEGPFYPKEIPLDFDADLIQVEGMSRPATGIVVHLTGYVLDANSKPVSGAKVEIWQCDAFGAYKHPRDRGDVSEPEFQGYGATSTLERGRVSLSYYSSSALHWSNSPYSRKSYSTN